MNLVFIPQWGCCSVRAAAAAHTEENNSYKSLGRKINIWLTIYLQYGAAHEERDHFPWVGYALGVDCAIELLGVRESLTVIFPLKETVFSLLSMFNLISSNYQTQSSTVYQSY